MRPEPIEFAAMGASRAARQAKPFSQRMHGSERRLPESRAADVLDEAFAEYSRVDVGTPVAEKLRAACNPPANSPVASGAANDWRALTRDLVADIAAQLETLNGQRQQLTRLLQSVEIGALTD